MIFRSIVLVSLLTALPTLSFADDSTVVVGTRTTKRVKKSTLNHVNDIVNLRIVEPHTLSRSEIKVDILFRLGNHFALGPSLAYMKNALNIHAGGAVYDLSFYTNRTNRTQYGARGIYYFKHVNKNSVYISTHARMATTEITSKSDLFDTNATASTQFDSTIAGATAGYQWSIGRIRAFVGGGAEKHFLPKSIDLNYNDGTQTSLLLKDEESTALVIDGGIGVTF